MLGHSLGGKVSMLMALQRPQRVPALVVADIAPVRYPRSHDTIIEAMLTVDRAAVRSRSEARASLLEAIAEPALVDFLLQSLARAGDRYVWRMDIHGIASHYDALLAGFVPPGETGPGTCEGNGEGSGEGNGDIVAPAVYSGPVTFIGGGASRYIRPEYEPQTRALFPSFRYREIADAGHWLHAEQPELFGRLVRRALV